MAPPGSSERRAPGSRAGRLDVGRRTALVVPQAYVAHRYGLDYVRVVDPSGSASDVAVQLAPTADPNATEVLSGLNDGDVVLKPRG